MKKSIRIKTIKAVYSHLTVAEKRRSWFEPVCSVSSSIQVADLFADIKG